MKARNLKPADTAETSERANKICGTVNVQAVHIQFQTVCCSHCRSLRGLPRQKANHLALMVEIETAVVESSAHADRTGHCRDHAVNRLTPSSPLPNDQRLRL